MSADNPSDQSPVDWSTSFRQVARQHAERPSYAHAAKAYRRSADAPDRVPGFVSQRIAILRNATVEPWLPELFAALLQRGVKASFQVGNYAAYEEYAADPTRLGEPKPDCVLLYFDPVELAGDARHDPPDDLTEALLARTKGIVTGLTERSSASVVVANLPPGPFETHALHSDQDPRSWHQRRRALNLALVEQLSSIPSVAILDLDRIVSEHGVSRAYDVRMAFMARNPFASTFLPRLAETFAEVVATLALPPKKCVVVDCDNTLWGGVLGEDGPEGVALGTDYPGSVYREFQLFLKGLGRRGFLLAINSKNNESDVLTFMAESPDMVLQATDFAARRVNWNDKATNIREIADELNIGLDSLIFVDDSPVECERVRTAFSEIQVEQFPSDPLAVPGFMASLRGTARLHVTEDDLKRAASIRANAEREKLRRAAPDLESFIRNLDIELVIRRQDRSAVHRISQLTQRTNQFNLTTKRYTVSDIERIMDAGVVYTISMKDRFSDYGVVGVAVVTASGSGWEIDSFLMSCRAFGRKIESALLLTVLDDAQRSGVQLVQASYVPSAKNGMTRQFYADHGFAEVSDAHEGTGSKAADTSEGPDGAATAAEHYVITLADAPPSTVADKAPYRVTLVGFDARTPRRFPEP